MNIRACVAMWQRACLGVFGRCLSTIGIGVKNAPVLFVVENADWSIRWDGEYTKEAINQNHPGCVALSCQPYFARNQIVHFGSQYMWVSWKDHMANDTHNVVSFFHGKYEDGPEVARHIDDFLASVPRLTCIVTAASVIERRLLAWGVPPEKIVRIPIGVDTSRFVLPTPIQRRQIREQLNIPEGAIVIGSFQKDGIGWGEGMQPKYIKGPDIFLGAVERLAKRHNVYVLLTGPARGFVKSGLDTIGVDYSHYYVQSQIELIPLYHALDMYFVTSREEGGPKGLIEAMSTGVPVISTRVGMAEDLIETERNGFLVEAEASAFELAASKLIKLNDHQRERLIANARSAVEPCDWEHVGRRHYEGIYQPVLKMLNHNFIGKQ